MRNEKEIREEKITPGELLSIIGATPVSVPPHWLVR